MKRFLPLLLVLALVAALVAVVLVVREEDPEAWDDFVADLGLSTDEEGIEGSGFIEATQVRVQSAHSGRVAAVLSAEGDTVAAGEVIVELESEALVAEARAAEATLAEAQAQLDHLTGPLRPEVLGAARLAVTQSEAAADAARRAWEDAASAPVATQVGAARTQYSVAQAGVEVAQAQLALAEAGPADYEIALAAATVRQARAQLRAVRAALEGLAADAPIDGIVLDVPVAEGETVMPGATLARVAQLDPVTLTIYVPEPDIGAVALGQPVEVTVDGRPDDTFLGRVAAIASEAEYTPKNVQTKDERASLVFAVRVRLPNENGDLKPGQPADAVVLDE